MSSPPIAPQPPRRWRILLLLSLAELLGMSLWFTASAVAPQLQTLWGLSAQQTGWLTTIVQLGFVAGTAVAAILNLADVVPRIPRRGPSLPVASSISFNGAAAVMPRIPGIAAPGRLIGMVASMGPRL